MSTIPSPINDPETPPGAGEDPPQDPPGHFPPEPLPTWSNRSKP